MNRSKQAGCDIDVKRPQRAKEGGLDNKLYI